jgi:hypothetical protein
VTLRPHSLDLPLPTRLLPTQRPPAAHHAHVRPDAPQELAEYLIHGIPTRERDPRLGLFPIGLDILFLFPKMSPPNRINSSPGGECPNFYGGSPCEYRLSVVSAHVPYSDPRMPPIAPSTLARWVATNGHLSAHAMPTPT